MMKDAEERDLLVMDSVRIDLCFRSGSAATKKANPPALPHHAHAQRPGFGFSDGFDHTIRAALARSPSTNGRDSIWFRDEIDHFVSTDRDRELKPLSIACLLYTSDAADERSS